MNAKQNTHNTKKEKGEEKFYLPTIEDGGRPDLRREHGVFTGPAQVGVERRPQVVEDGALLCLLVFCC